MIDTPIKSEDIVSAETKVHNQPTEEEDPELLLDFINKPPPIERGGKKPKFQFF